MWGGDLIADWKFADGALAMVILNTNNIYALFQTSITQDCMSSEKSVRFYYNWHCSAGAMKSHPKETRPTKVQLNDKKRKVWMFSQFWSHSPLWWIERDSETFQMKMTGAQHKCYLKSKASVHFCFKYERISQLVFNDEMPRIVKK